MRCPFCAHVDTTVKDSRTTEDQATIRRRRLCPECGSRFTTYERVQLRELMVLKRDGTRRVFDRDKLAHSIKTALHKRSVDTERVEQVINAIIRRLETLGEAEISTQRIGELAMESLVHLDPVAYVRFASIYHQFGKVDDFVKFISNMTKKDT